MEERKLEVYDESASYYLEVKPLMDQLYKACERNNIPMFITVAVACDDKGNSQAVSSFVSGGKDRMPIAYGMLTKIVRDKWVAIPKEMMELMGALGGLAGFGKKNASD